MTGGRRSRKASILASIDSLERQIAAMDEDAELQAEADSLAQEEREITDADKWDVQDDFGSQNEEAMKNNPIPADAAEKQLSASEKKRNEVVAARLVGLAKQLLK
jgi:hypothetical protein